MGIADACDSVGQMEADYAAAIYVDGSIALFVVEVPLYNDVLVFIPARVGIADEDELDPLPAKNPPIFCLTNW